MPNWSQSMEQSFEYYTVDPYTWGDDKLVTTVTNCTITRDLSSETLGSATLDADEDINDKYVRVYLVTLQNRIKERFCLGTFLAQTSDFTYDGMRRSMSYSCYTPIIELKEKPMTMGTTILKNENLLLRSVQICEESVRCPVTPATDDSSKVILEKDFVAEPGDTRLTFLTDLLAIGKYSFGLDDMHRILFQPYQEIAALKPKWKFNDQNSSILYPEISLSGDLYNVPNVVEVIFSPQDSSTIVVTKINDDPNSDVSTIKRGRQIVLRDTNPSVPETATEGQVEAYAENLLREKSTVSYEISYSHGYCPITIGDGVRLEYESAGIAGVNAKVTRQVIHCSPGCKVEETAIFTKKLWGEF